MKDRDTFYIESYSMKESTVIFIKQLLSYVYLLLTAGLLISVVFILRLHCESFGCIGIGILWFAWAVVSALTLIAGVVLRAFLTASLMKKIVGISACLHGSAALILVFYWGFFSHNT